MASIYIVLMIFKFKTFFKLENAILSVSPFRNDSSLALQTLKLLVENSYKIVRKFGHIFSSAQWVDRQTKQGTTYTYRHAGIRCTPNMHAH